MEDIRLRPLPKNGIEDATPINPKNVPENVPGVSSPGLGGDGEATLYDYSDCSVLLPVARCVIGFVHLPCNFLWNSDVKVWGFDYFPFFLGGDEDGI